MANGKPQTTFASPESRTPPDPMRHPSAGRRWAGIILRTAHIATAAVFFGGCVLRVSFPPLSLWHHGAIASGCLLLILELLHDRCWIHRGKGLLGLLHIGFGLLIHLIPSTQIPLLWLILISGCIGSHMPRRFRHWSFFDGPEKSIPQSPSL